MNSIKHYLESTLITKISVTMLARLAPLPIKPSTRALRLAITFIPAALPKITDTTTSKPTAETRRAEIPPIADFSWLIAFSIVCMILGLVFLCYVSRYARLRNRAKIRMRATKPMKPFSPPIEVTIADKFPTTLAPKIAPWPKTISAMIPRATRPIPSSDIDLITSVSCEVIFSIFLLCWGELVAYFGKSDDLPLRPER